MFRGEIWNAVWPNDSIAVPRPVLIVSNNHRNAAQHLLDLVIVKITVLTRADGSKKPINENEDIIYQGKKASIIQCGSIYSIEKRTLKNLVGKLTVNEMKVVDEKLRNVLNLN